MVKKNRIQGSGFRNALRNLAAGAPICCLLAVGAIRAQMPANTPIFPVNAKWVTDRGSQVFNVKAYGAKGDGVTDDTAAIQSVLDLFTNGSVGIADGTIYFPPGHYKVTNYLWYMGDVSHSLRLQGGAGTLNGDLGSAIDYYGPASSLGVFMVMGGAGLVVDSMAFNCRSLAQYGVWIASTNTVNATLGTSVSPGTQTVTPSNMNNIAVGSLLNIDTGVGNVEFVVVTAVTSSTFTATFQKSHVSTAQVGNSSCSQNTRFQKVSVYGVSGANASGIAIGSPSGGEASEMDFDDCYITAASAGGAYAAINLLYGFNNQNYRMHGGAFINFQYGWHGHQAQTVQIIETGFYVITTAFIWDDSDALTVTGSHAEAGTGMFLTGGLVGNATLTDNDWYTTLSNTNDIVISWQGSLVLLNNRLYNQRTSNSVPKISVGGATFLQTPDPVEVFSSGNFFGSAQAGYAPFTDSAGNALLPRYRPGAGLGTATITSLNDMGDCTGTGFPACHLNNFVPVSFLASTGSADIAGSGVLNVGDTECAVAFLNHAKSADVPGICKNTSDVVLLGGTPGVSASQYSSTVAIGTPPLSVTSTTPVANLTVQNCDTCNITTSMTVGGGTALHAMNLYSTASITPTAVTASSCSDQTFAVSGLLATDRVSSIAPPSALGNLSLAGYASAANTVLLHFCNPSSSSVTPPPGVYSFLAVH